MFNLVEGQNQPYDNNDTQPDKSFLNNLDSLKDIDSLSPNEKKIYFEDVLKVKLPFTKFSKRLNVELKEPEMVPLLTWQLYNWQMFTRRNRPTWVTHDGPAFASGAPHLGLFYNKVISYRITIL